MALTIAFHTRGAGDELSLTFDSPRIVVGRSKSCEVMLLDPSVARRHATIRQEGGRVLIADEGSLNGILVGNVRLPAHSPRALDDGEWVRVGRVWLEVRLGAGVPSSVPEARAVAIELFRRQLREAGEDSGPRVELLDAKEATLLQLDDPAREYLIGRSRECDLPVPDGLCSRRHASVTCAGGQWQVRDLGSKGGSELVRHDGATVKLLPGEPVPWMDGERLRLGTSELVLRDPLPEAIEEALALPEVKMRNEELFELPPGHPSPDEEPPAVIDAPPDAPIDGELRAAPLRPPAREPDSTALVAVDAVVVLIALGVLALSLAGLWWVLR